MNNRNYISKPNLTLQLVIVFLLFGVFGQNNAIAQVKIDNSKVILVDTLKFDKDKKGFLNKIIQPIKFRDNRDRNESQRMYDFMMGLVDSGQLHIDTATIYQIIEQLDTIQGKNKKNKEDIEAVINNNNLYKKASKEVIDSLKIQMSAVVQEDANNSSKEKRDLITEVNDQLKEIKKVQYSCASNLSLIDSMDIGDTTRYYFKRCLNPKVKVIGWYYWRLKDEYKNYNYNYLSAINLYGYELSVTGKPQKPGYITEFEKPGGVVDVAQENSCDVHLTVYNTSSAITASFLNNTDAQDTLIKELQLLIEKDSLKGINLFFEHIREADSQNYILFVSKLKDNLANNNVELYITIPAIINDESYKKISAYNFEELNSMVDYYLVRTGEMASQGADIAQSQSPLFNSNNYGNRSIESTINFYNDREIPSSKLILTVSYLGIKWRVNNFTGELKLNQSEDKDIGFRTIVDTYFNKKVEGRTVDGGFDPDQVSSFLNVIEDDGRTEQIWYEDFMSLYTKYNWVLDNELGGVSIRAMGYDDGYSELWNTIGGVLMNIDTVYTGTKSLKVDTLAELKLKDYVEIFIEDFKWAVAVDLEYIENDSTLIPVMYDSIKDSVYVYQSSPQLWRNWQPYKTEKLGEGTTNPLENIIVCYCLFARWQFYALILFWSWIIALGLIAILYFVSLYFKRYKCGSKTARQLLKIGQGLFAILFVIAISCWLYLSPSIDLIGASSEGSSMLVLFLALFFGAVIGWLVNSWYNNEKHMKKNLP